ncbi:uncharacterized protein LOC106170838 [Lingula anatina]|uniref:Uncharacterized protein LOC106170838 n=1 Tax=Lingula anatina TaxID=7574 RepID=A0A1S3J7K4_LINAN|nr:uncharacterized protein LOC106170838 [Lingula anatina]|eukprot:XP_013406288.1 uncharacterized protein LOC106170838 [Lingula anatina]
MKFPAFLAFVFSTLVALELVHANELKLKMDEIPKNKRLKNLKRENPAEMKRMMKAKGLIDISEEEGLVPLITATDGTAVPDQYIAHLLPEGDYGKIRSILKRSGSQQKVRFTRKSSYAILKGIKESDLQQLRQLTDVIAEIEQDKAMSIDGSYCTGPSPASNTWNLDRIDDERDDDSFTTWATGSGIDAYVMDTGINPDHADFGGRVSSGWHGSSFSDTRDTHGHGTHVASTLGGDTYGAAKQVNLIPVKVCSWTGCPTSDILAGLNWIKSRVQQNKRLSIINMSLGGGYSSYLNDAVYAVLDAGIPVVVAAGNDGKANACNVSPASVSGALTVGATQIDDYLAPFSNIGPCVDIYAPGRKIRGAYYASTHGSVELDGTSMASPLVAGAAAGLLQAYADAGFFSEPSTSVVDTLNYDIIQYAEKGTVKGLPSSNNNNVMLHTTCLTT